MGDVWKSYAKMTASSWVPLVGIACYPYVPQKKKYIDKSNKIVLYVNAVDVTCMTVEKLRIKEIFFFSNKMKCFISYFFSYRSRIHILNFMILHMYFRKRSRNMQKMKNLSRIMSGYCHNWKEHVVIGQLIGRS